MKPVGLQEGERVGPDQASRSAAGILYQQVAVVWASGFGLVWNTGGPFVFPTVAKRYLYLRRLDQRPLYQSECGFYGVPDLI